MDARLHNQESTPTHGLIWKLSPWDHTVHAYRTLGEVVSGAICSHSALTGRLAEPNDTDRRCQGCLMIHGIELAQHHGDRDRYGT